MTPQNVNREELARILERLADILQANSVYDYEKALRISALEIRRLAKELEGWRDKEGEGQI